MRKTMENEESVIDSLLACPDYASSKASVSEPGNEMVVVGTTDDPTAVGSKPTETKRRRTARMKAGEVRSTTPRKRKRVLSPTLSNKENVRVARSSDNGARPKVVLEKMGERENTEVDVEEDRGDKITREELNTSDETYLYVSDEMFSQMISSAENSTVQPNGDVYLNCQEVETEHGRMLMLTSDKVAKEEVVVDADTVVFPAVGEVSSADQPSKLASAFQDIPDAVSQLEEVFQGSGGGVPLQPPAILYSPGTADSLQLEPLNTMLAGRNKVFDPETNHCLICDTSFDDMDSLRLHFTFYHAQKNNTMLRCWECKLCFKKAAEYMEHKARHHPDKENICTICGELMATARSLQRHLNRHLCHGVHKCETCGRSFRNRQSLQDHEKNKHRESDKPDITCTHCSARFKHKRSLQRHISSVHAGQRVQCHTCNKSYSSISSLYVHQRTIHEKVAFHCGYCSMVFKSVSAIKKHETLMHHDIEMYRESPTEKVYNYNQYVSPHVEDLRRSKKGSTLSIRCMFCRAIYSDHATYAKHYNKFHRDENTDMLVCDGPVEEDPDS